MFDSNGNQYDIARIVIGGRADRCQLHENFPPGLPVRIGFVAESIPDGVTSVTLSLGLTGDIGRVILLRGVPIAR